MSVPDSRSVLMLVRAAPESAAARAALIEAVALSAPGSNDLTVFFHGAAVTIAAPRVRSGWPELAGRAGVRLLVCEAAWRRRFGPRASPRFTLSTLVRFWQEATMARRILSYGAGDDG